MNQELKNKREELKAISAGFRILVKEGAINSINEGLVKYYAEQGHTTLKTYRRWKADGYQVRKGSKALLLWGERRTYTKRTGATQREWAGDKADFFPVAFVFSNLQVNKV